MTLYSAFADIVAPTNPNSETIAVSLGTEFVCTGEGWLVGYRVVRPSIAMTGPVDLAFFDTVTATADPGSQLDDVPLTGVGWLVYLLPTAVHYPAGGRFRATMHTASGRYPFLNNAFASDGTWPAGRTNGPLFVPPSVGTANGQGLFRAGASIQMPTNMFDETFYFVDIIWSDTNPDVRFGTGLPITVNAGLSTTAGHKEARGSGAMGVRAAMASTGRTVRRGSGLIVVETDLAATGRKEATGTGTPIEVHAAMSGTGRDPADVTPRSRLRVGPPTTRLIVGPPTT